MRILLLAAFVLLLLSFGCLRMYSDTINENCHDELKYNSSYAKMECLAEKSRYYAAFGQKEEALDACNEIKDGFITPRGLGAAVGESLNIFPSNSVAVYNSCIEEVAVASDDTEICSQQMVPHVFSAIGAVFSAVPSLSKDSLSEAVSKGCVDNVRFSIARRNALGGLMPNFIQLMTSRPDQ